MLKPLISHTQCLILVMLRLYHLNSKTKKSVLSETKIGSQRTIIFSAEKPILPDRKILSGFLLLTYWLNCFVNDQSTKFCSSSIKIFNCSAVVRFIDNGGNSSNVKKPLAEVSLFVTKEPSLIEQAKTNL